MIIKQPTNLFDEFRNRAIELGFSVEGPTGLLPKEKLTVQCLAIKHHMQLDMEFFNTGDCKLEAKRFPKSDDALKAHLVQPAISMSEHQLREENSRTFWMKNQDRLWSENGKSYDHEQLALELCDFVS